MWAQILAIVSGIYYDEILRQSERLWVFERRNSRFFPAPRVA